MEKEALVVVDMEEGKVKGKVEEEEEEEEQWKEEETVWPSEGDINVAQVIVQYKVCIKYLNCPMTHVSPDMVQKHLKRVIEGRAPSTHNVICDGSTKSLKP